MKQELNKMKFFKDLDYKQFKKLAENDKLSIYEKIGFPDEYRKGKEEIIFEDILYKVPIIKERNKDILDIGPGCSDLPNYIISLCKENNHNICLNDNKEMLELLPNADFITKIEGFYPDSIYEIKKKFIKGLDVIICYSVFHYIVFASNLWDFIDGSIELLKNGGQMIIGDIPNISKRKRFFSSPTGIEFHRKFTNTNTIPLVEYNKIEKNEIDDSIIKAIVERAHFNGCDAYIVPQRSELPMSNRRDDILIRKP